MTQLDGKEAIVRAGAMAGEEDDPALEPFLRLLANDIEAHPERLRGIPEELYQQWMAITVGVEVDPDDTFDGAVCLQGRLGNGDENDEDAEANPSASSLFSSVSST